MTPSSPPARTLELPEVGQIAIVVADLEKAIEYYERTIGLGPFRRVEKDFDPVFYRGEKISSKWLLAFAAMGPTQYELIQPVSGPSLYREFLERHGEGLHHLGFYVDDLDERVARYRQISIGVLMEGRDATVAFAYLDTVKVGGVIFELIERKTPPA